MTAVSADLTIGQVSEQTGLSVHTLRFYEDEQLFVGPVRRNSAGRRLFSELEVQWLRICTRLRTTGMPISEIKRYAELVRIGPGNEAARFELLQRHQAKVEADLAELTAAHDIIKAKVAIYANALAKGSATEMFTGLEAGCAVADRHDVA